MFSSLLRVVSPEPVSGDILPQQAGVVPYRMIEGRVAFLLITARRSGRWIFPKGAPMEGLQLWETGAREAFEEAGIEGEVEAEPVGSYRTRRSDAVRSLVEVQMYPMLVHRQLEEWPEKNQRHRHWATVREARRLLSDRQLAEIAVSLNRRLTGRGTVLKRSA
ncbi:NUDIX hydrolase [Arsenicitalea aurantiaca]|uniref:NUDIX hydrolase n=1 Tax=Arsenicitalea aurantiaca TaxID=1783274 RepID=A0A433XB78_9HYPH|nr:NUDIX hydrolase [Arsenicitalea aurantiaca]RUT31347.1 NUDIX hydrolase [Arsenicitalea aurantiaca]